MGRVDREYTKSASACPVCLHASQLWAHELSACSSIHTGQAFEVVLAP